MLSKFLLISFVLILVAYLFEIIGFSTTYHSDLDVLTSSIHAGLWKLCTTTSGLTVCVDIPESTEDEGWFRAFRAFHIIAMISFPAAAICTALKLFVLKENKIFLFAAIATAFTAAISILISTSLLAQNKNDFAFNGVDPDYGWSFAISIVGMCIAIAAGVVMIIDLVKGNSDGKVNSKV